MKFSYTAINKEGQKYTGSIEAQNKSDFYTEFKKLGETLVQVKEQSGKKLGLSTNITMFERIKIMDKIIFARNLGNMLEAGLSLSRAISVMERQTPGVKLKGAYKGLNDAISSGKSFHEALELYPKIFPPLFVAMVKVGEEGGNLAETLKQVGVQMEKSYMLTKKIKGAMMYPSIIIFVMITIAILMMIYVVPGLTNTFKEMKVALPTSTKVIIAISDFISVHYIITLGGFIGSTIGLLFIGKTKAGSKMFDLISLKLPVIGAIVKEGNSAQTARTLSSLLTSGVDLVMAVKITSDVLQNSYYKKALISSQAVIEKGEPLSKMFIQETKLFPLFVGEMMSVGEETGRMAPMLAGVATFYENEVEMKTKDLSTIIEPVLMVFIGASVGFFAISMIKPIYSVMNNIQ
ncbi:MAG: type II secretion system F family protein [Candidatus Pacebacteria bacterium]|nr:type II secretion system F family protein [Candidatus Paceibacterota bacterium]